MSARDAVASARVTLAGLVAAVGGWVAVSANTSACGGSHPPVGAPSPASATSSVSGGREVPARASASGPWSPAGSPSGSVATGRKAGIDDAQRWAWSAIACWIGPPWAEALGALGAESSLAARARCREVLTWALGGKEDDDKAVAALRSIDSTAVRLVLDALVAPIAPGATAPVAIDARRRESPKEPSGDDHAWLVQLVKATAEAAREAMMARRAAAILRQDAGAKEPARVDQEIRAAASKLRAKDALATLLKLDLGAHSPEAKVPALVIAADHLEAARGLDPRVKIDAASPALETVLGVPTPPGGVDAKPGDWLAYVTAGAAAAGHPVTLPPQASTHDREQAAFGGVAAGFADRFEALAAKLPPGEAYDAATGYARRLRVELADAEKRMKAKQPPPTTGATGATGASGVPAKKGAAPRK